MRNFFGLILLGFFIVAGLGVLPASAKQPCEALMEETVAANNKVNWHKKRNIEQKALAEIRKAERAMAKGDNKACHSALNLAMKKIKKQ